MSKIVRSYNPDQSSTMQTFRKKYGLLWDDYKDVVNHLENKSQTKHFWDK